MEVSGQSNAKEIFAEAERLLVAMAEQVKLPLMQISRLSELARLTADNQLEGIEATADSALQFIDNYLLSNRLIHSQQAFKLETVSLSSVLYDTAHSLSGLARQYDCDVEVHVGGKYGPVMAHGQGLRAALVSLGQVFIESQPRHANTHRPVLTVAAHRVKDGIVAGTFAPVDGLSPGAYRRARILHAQAARQPFNGTFAGNGAGVFIAETILQAMSVRLRVARYHNVNGLAATFVPSRQLTLI